jgi:hypothetical protein
MKRILLGLLFTVLLVGTAIADPSDEDSVDVEVTVEYGEGLSYDNDGPITFHISADDLANYENTDHKYAGVSDTLHYWCNYDAGALRVSFTTSDWPATLDLYMYDGSTDHLIYDGTTTYHDFAITGPTDVTLNGVDWMIDGFDYTIEPRDSSDPYDGTVSFSFTDEQ